MVLERLQSIFCISSVTKQNVLHYPTLRIKVSLEINLGCLIHPLSSNVDRTNIDRIDMSLTSGQSRSHSN